MYPRIRDLREAKHLSQRELGELLSCSQRVYSNYERGEVDVPTRVLIDLARIHRTTCDYLLGLSDSREIKTQMLS